MATSTPISKRSHKTLTIDEKLTVLDELEKRKTSYTILCEKYGIGRSTITSIKKQGDKLREYKRKMVEMGFRRPAKMMKMGADEELEKAVYLWFIQKREHGVPITGPILRAKARDLFQKIHEAPNESTTKVFTASTGWVWRFCKRHNIREVSLQGEKLSADKPASTNFVTEFRAFVQEKDYNLDQIFNCDETGLYYKLLPQKSLVAHFERSADGRKTQKERITICACSNASGTIKLPLVLIGKSKSPRCFKGINKESLPVVYFNQKNAWVNTTIFTEWYHQHFVPYIKIKLNELGLDSKAVLLIDNCSAHPSEQDLISDDKKVITQFLPPNVTSLIQPMDQGVLVSIKRIYRRKILEELVLHDNHSTGTSIITFLKGINLLKVSEMISSSWNDIKDLTLRRSWGKIFPIESSPECLQIAHEGHDTTESDEDFTTLFQIVGQEVNETEITEWLQFDNNEKGYGHLTDEEIVTEVTNHVDSENEGNEEISMDSEPSGDIYVSHSDALRMFDSCITWLLQQEEANTYNLSVLKQLRELAARKRLSSLQQKRLDDFFAH